MLERPRSPSSFLSSLPSCLRSCFSFQRNYAKIHWKVRDRTSLCDAHIASIESCKHRSTRVIDATSVREIDRSRDRLAFYLMATRRSMTDGQPAPSRGNNRANAFIVICYDRGNLRGRWTESRFAPSNEDRCRLVRRSKVRRLCSCFVVAPVVRCVDSVSKERYPQRTRGVRSQTLAGLMTRIPFECT